MFGNILTRIFGSKSERDINKIIPIVEEINKLYEEYHSLTDEQLREKTNEFKKAIAEEREKIKKENSELLEEELEDLILEREKELLDEILPQAYAMVKEVCRRLMGKSWEVCKQKIVWDMIPFDVQLIGAVVLHQGKIAEMVTGEGKTLVATMPLYLNSLTGRGVHLVTVNDYLAKRDAQWMGKIYETLGVSVGCILNDMDPEQRKAEYRKDITYGTNNEFGFDYLRDNMAISEEDIVQKGHYYAIVDEVDSVLIDEARTPLIISGPASVSTHKFNELKPYVEKLVKMQAHLVNKIISDTEKLLNEGNDYEAGVKLLQSHRGAPKNKKLLKIFKEAGTKKLMRQVENDFLRDKKMHEIDEVLYFSIDEKGNIIDLTEKGREVLSPNDPETFVLPDLSVELHTIETAEYYSPEEKERRKEELQRSYGEKSERIHNISQLLKAYSLFEKDVEYVVSEGKVMIVDEFTGRVLPGRRYSDGLHQALEAKENVKIERATQTLATITLQNYFRLYKKLAGMTGTAYTEAAEFYEIYKLDVTVIPTNRPVIRINYDDRIYRTKREKYNAVINEIEEMISNGRPVLVGTVSVDVSETLSRMLKRRGIKHSVLNAKYHQQEAEIITNAGRAGVVTIATNMAGRGTDIKLGQGVVEADGLHIVGTERHEARRIDLQLKGRSGRQGDPGSSRFYLSLEDDLMRLFGSDRIAGVMDKLGAKEGEVIQHPLITRSIEKAQKRVEMHNFDIRKHLLEYDDVMNHQREVVYDRRKHALMGKNLKNEILQIMDEIIENAVYEFTDSKSFPEEWDLEELKEKMARIMLLKLDLPPDKIQFLKQEELMENIRGKAHALYEKKEEVIESDLMRKLERIASLRVIDERWKEHLYEMDQLKEGIGLRAYGQKDPLIEYKREGYNMFVDMINRTNEEIMELIFKAQISEEAPPSRRMPAEVVTQHASANGMGFSGTGNQQTNQPYTGKRKPVRVKFKIGRNDPCPCGSGKKYKKCCGKTL